ncbi:hypothetical protein XM38_039810 [Halomicronema hongdechloris C2206]|uniref:Uncharacterized protein n=1 Tax=Halomicronema hongdechloris C2206 TaxID=1641165 RepID=A0A1Z3HRT5_9CYAN|nr:hypothetical protein [Halomicronema hongdechloris]ASC73019.1 hypothetical protein XM38_039810 [Halomicronema hongdechloris C2206]
MTTLSQPITFSPGLQAADASANAWLRQVTLRLRRRNLLALAPTGIHDGGWNHYPACLGRPSQGKV